MEQDDQRDRSTKLPIQPITHTEPQISVQNILVTDKLLKQTLNKSNWLRHFFGAKTVLLTQTEVTQLITL